MQIVINIDEETYNDIKKGKIYSSFRDVPLESVNAIANGTLLPKGHGKLGDLDALREEISSWGMNDYEPLDFIDAIDWADTIIEADKESEEI